MHSTKIEINTKNTRDLGGIKTKDGHLIKYRQLYRSDALFNMSDEDMKTLYDKYNLRHIIDLRNKSEKLEKPDSSYEGIEYIHHPVQDIQDFGMAKDEESIKAMNDYFDKLYARIGHDKDLVIYHMSGFYKSLAINDYTASRYSEFIKMILDFEGAILWHCSMGKDRAGIATLLVLEILGVDREDIYEDYLYTNQCYGFKLPFDDPLMYTQATTRQYLDTYYEEIEKKYGSFREFLYKNDINDEIIEKIRLKYLLKY